MGFLDLFRAVEKIPVCSWCSRVRTGPGRWEKPAGPEVFPGAVGVSAGICPDCRHANFNEIRVKTPVQEQ